MGEHSFTYGREYLCKWQEVALQIDIHTVAKNRLQLAVNSQQRKVNGQQSKDNRKKIQFIGAQAVLSHVLWRVSRCGESVSYTF